jgi:hypothetical protein
MAECPQRDEKKWTEEDKIVIRQGCHSLKVVVLVSQAVELSNEYTPMTSENIDQCMIVRSVAYSCGRLRSSNYL